MILEKWTCCHVCLNLGGKYGSCIPGRYLEAYIVQIDTIGSLLSFQKKINEVSMGVENWERPGFTQGQHLAEFLSISSTVEHSSKRDECDPAPRRLPINQRHVWLKKFWQQMGSYFQLLLDQLSDRKLLCLRPCPGVQGNRRERQLTSHDSKVGYKELDTADQLGTTPLGRSHCRTP